MTKEEIQKNIDYNQGQADACDRTIYSLNSKISSLQGTLSNLEWQIQNLERDRKVYKEKESQVTALQTKFSNLYNNFTAKQSKRVNGFNNLFSKNRTMNFLKSYANGMQDLLTGNEYKKVCTGLDTATGRVKGELDRILRTIQTIESELRNKQNQYQSVSRDISSYRGQLNNEESRRNSFRSSANYWRSQLAYATS